MNAREAVERGLLEQYAPVLKYHDQEPLRADSPAIMTDAALPGVLGARLVTKQGEVLAAAAPSAGQERLDLGFLGESYRGGGRKALKTDRIVTASSDWERDAREMRRTHPEYADRVYAHAVREGGRGRVWLQYWLFYYFNDKGLKGLGDHDGDWETIQIGLDRAGKPELATFAQHTYGERREWKDVRTLGDDPEGPPIVWVALGSHASYFERGNYRIKRLPVPAPIFDYAKNDRVQVRPVVERLDDADVWLGWPGRWGAEGGPEGPYQHTQYLKPRSWHTSSRVSGKRRFQIFGTFLEAEGPPPEPLSLSARQVGDAVDVEWELPPLLPGRPGTPVRLVVSVRRDDGSSPAVTQSIAVTEPEGAVRLSLPLGSGPLEAALTTFDAADQDSETARVSVTSAPERVEREGGPVPIPPPPPAARALRPAEAAASLRLLVETEGDEGEAAAALSAAVDEALVVDAEGAPWTVAPLFPRTGGSVPEGLRPFWTVTGRVPVSPAYPFTALAFDLARALADASGFEVQPDLPSSAYGREDGEGGGAPEGARGAGARERDPAADWAIRAMRLDRAEPLEPTFGAGVTIAQPDTGITGHPAIALADRTQDADVIDSDDDATDPLESRLMLFPSPGHGTSTASVILGPGPGAPLGAAPAATLVPIRAVSSVVQVLDGDVARAVDYARRLGVDVITMSLGGLGFFRAMRESIAAAVEEGIIVMAAGGNEAWWVVAPARFPECLAVAATGPDDEPWSRSSDGPQIDWSAPGESVWVAETTRRRDGGEEYDEGPHNGSSFAVAHSAGIAARWIALHGRDELRQRYGPAGVQWAFRSLVRSTARRPAGWDPEEHGAGIIDAEALLAEPLPPRSAGGPPGAAGPEARGREARRTGVARLETVLPEAPADGLPDRLAELLGVPKERVGRTLRGFEGELAYHLTEDRELHAAMAVRPGAEAAEPGVAAHARLAGIASLGLRARIDPPRRASSR